ncbi:uncharacterized protein si:ch211-269k10.4 isoform X3 [Thunnus albacares]|uniref:uncharacterized protein si:ch211-269k10.4 isoform X3 n=1 Tax=Thunnus albacares TaxID=8236 RepID=UPI001CF6B506|nr:uncharacterized protein si:ch211-269k10.4 isoform X3 [Thunnus albacares]
MACADVDMDIQGDYDEPGEAMSLIQYYQATEIIPDKQGPLHNLLQKQPAVLGSLQMMSGVFSVGVGILFAATQGMDQSLFTLFRVSHLTGILFIVAGVVSNLLFKYPGLLHLSLNINCGCIIVAAIAAYMITVDLADWNPDNEHHLKMEVMELCMLLLEVVLSAILCFWFSKEKHAESP